MLSLFTLCFTSFSVFDFGFVVTATLMRLSDFRELKNNVYNVFSFYLFFPSFQRNSITCIHAYGDIIRVYLWSKNNKKFEANTVEKRHKLGVGCKPKAKMEKVCFCRWDRLYTCCFIGFVSLLMVWYMSKGKIWALLDQWRNWNMMLSWNWRKI